jgi:hypothetical protein
MSILLIAPHTPTLEDSAAACRIVADRSATFMGSVTDDGRTPFTTYDVVSEDIGDAGFL